MGTASPPELYRASLDAIARVALDAEARPAGSDAEDLARVGAVRVGLLSADWRPVAEALARPVGTLRLDHRTSAGRRRIEGWIGSGLALLAVPVDRERVRLLVAAPGELPWLLAELVDLESRGEPDAPVTSVDAEDLPRRPGPHGNHFRIATAWRYDGQVVRAGLGVIDDGTSLTLLEPSDAGRLRRQGVDAVEVLLAMASLLPVAPRPPAWWRPMRRDHLRLELAVPGDWRCVGRGPRYVTVEAPPPEPSEPADRAVDPEVPRTSVTVYVAPVGPEAALTAWRETLGRPRRLARREVALPAGGAMHELTLHSGADTPRVAIAWALAREAETVVVAGSLPVGALVSDLGAVEELARGVRLLPSRVTG